MVKVRRGNTTLRVDEVEVVKYMAKGFSVIDANGNIVKQSVPTEIGQLQKAYSEHVEVIKQKDAEIAKLKSEIESLKKEKAGEKKSSASKSKLFPADEVEESEKTEATEEGWDDWGDAEEIEETKPVKKNKKSAK